MASVDRGYVTGVPKHCKTPPLWASELDLLSPLCQYSLQPQPPHYYSRGRPDRSLRVGALTVPVASLNSFCRRSCPPTRTKDLGGPGAGSTQGCSPAFPLRPRGVVPRPRRPRDHSAALGPQGKDTQHAATGPGIRRSPRPRLTAPAARRAPLQTTREPAGHHSVPARGPGPNAPPITARPSVASEVPTAHSASTPSPFRALPSLQATAQALRTTCLRPLLDHRVSPVSGSNSTFCRSPPRSAPPQGADGIARPP
ncbi:hypothetical protein NDU88_005416 [Pleurodeles waltl]|uniref:Uncharacterized protein n=1 Tax=Pleurodeles waltl TaxID=8319 RepID=A0AAV7W7S2_PLEWA|nr:hypothetical protein NDU88_005416 [Pleurodeles waltl]